MKPRATVGILITLALSADMTVASASRAPLRSHSATLGERLAAALPLITSDPKRAASQLRGLLRRESVIEDYLLYFFSLSLREIEPAQARAALERIIADHPSSAIAPKATAELAELLLETGDTNALAKLARSWNGDRASADEGARVALAAGRALVAESPAAAAEQLMRARRLAPRSQSAKDAVDLVRRLRDTHSELRPDTATEIYGEARLTQREGNLGAQAELLDRFLKAYPDDRRALDATLARGKAMARLENRSRAAAWLDARASAASDTRAKARLLFAAAGNYWNAHANDEALQRFAAMLELDSGVAEEQHAHYAIARIHEGASRYTAAAVAYRTAAKGRDTELARESRWRAGWASYRAGNYDGAAWVFRLMAEAAAEQTGAKPSGREDALYWQARSLERSGREDKAHEIYRVLLSEFPDGFYAYLAEKRSGLAAAAPTVSVLEPGSGALSEPLRTALARTRELHAAGLDDLAVAEVREALASAPPLTRRRALPELPGLGAHTSALRTSLELYRKNLLEEQQLYPYLYPKAFADIVVPASQAQGLDPYLVFSLMRQESLFDQRVVSPASAYGLMQLLPSTARRVAAQAGLEALEPEDLFRPEVNVKLGTAYLAELAHRFDNDPVLMLAGYNAGENAAARWRDRLRGIEMDEFIERISYRETRNYVKKVLRNYRNYLRLYGEVSAGTAAESIE